jgi:prepilin-type processing-associated H-X9-DG protein
MSLSTRNRVAFSLVELLVVMGIIAVLIALLVPALVAARRSSQSVQCASNLRQLSLALVNYATEYKGAFPPNSGDLQVFWYQKQMLGKTTQSKLPTGDTVLGGVMLCPRDFEDSYRSYSMNVFASSTVSHFVQPSLDADPPAGRLFRMGVGNSSAMILLAESWSEWGFPEGADPPDAYIAPAIIGLRGTPGQKFGAAGGVNWSQGRFGPRASQIAFYRHKSGKDYSLIDPNGRANISFADGHVSLLSNKELADYSTGKSTYLAMWSPMDRELDIPPAAP